MRTLLPLSRQVGAFVVIQSPYVCEHPAVVFSGCLELSEESDVCELELFSGFALVPVFSFDGVLSVVPVLSHEVKQSAKIMIAAKIRAMWRFITTSVFLMILGSLELIFTL